MLAACPPQYFEAGPMRPLGGSAPFALYWVLRHDHPCVTISEPAAVIEQTLKALVLTQQAVAGVRTCALLLPINPGYTDDEGELEGLIRETSPPGR